MTKDEAKQFLHKHMTVVGCSGAIEEPDTEFLTKYATPAGSAYVISIVGATGVQGDTGEQGDTGVQGDTGEQGSSGEE